MKLQVPFVQLPLRFDAERLADEMQVLGEAAWRPHPQKYPGNFALPLIAVNGDPESDAIAGPMLPTRYLRECPYLTQVLARLGAVWGRTRLMKLAGGAEVTPHADINYYWRDRLRVHVPIQTQPGVRFICGDAEVHMAPGECWIFDTWRPHRVLNVPDRERIHLVADTVGGERFWDLAGRGRVPGRAGFEGWAAEPFEGTGTDADAQLLLESVNVPQVMTPWELRNHLDFILAHATPHPQLASVQQQANRFMADWHAVWAQHGESRAGWPEYRRLLNAFAAHMQDSAASLQLANGMQFMSTLRSMVLGVALADRRGEDTGEELRVPADATS